jgi:outer membrane protein assembly factor BamB
MRVPRTRPATSPRRFSPGSPVIIAVILVVGVAAGPALADPVFEWADLYDGGANLPDVGTAVLADPDGNVIVGGESGDGVAGVDMLVRKLDRETGQTIWTRRVPSFDTNDMALSGMVWDGTGHVLVGGYIRGCVG